jgi:hypothetical protein
MRRSIDTERATGHHVHAATAEVLRIRVRSVHCLTARRARSDDRDARTFSDRAANRERNVPTNRP